MDLTSSSEPDEVLEVAFATTNMLGHLMPLLPYIRECWERGHTVTIFVPNEEKYKTAIHGYGLKGDSRVNKVNIIEYEAIIEHPNRIYHMLTQGGPMTVPMYEKVVSYYEDKIGPHVMVADFFASGAVDAADALCVPVVTVFPNPQGLTSLVHPKLRTLMDIPGELFACVGEGVLARLLCLVRNWERARRTVGRGGAKVDLPPLREQDIYPCLSMRRPMIALSGLGLEYPFPQSPLLKYTGPCPPSSFPALSVCEGLAEWMAAQKDTVVYVAFGTMNEFRGPAAVALYEQLCALILNSDNVSVLWSLPHDQQGCLPVRVRNDKGANNNRLRIEAFVPQYAVLSESKVGVFVTHCGANSTYEALLTQTPMVCVPTGKDQGFGLGLGLRWLLMETPMVCVPTGKDQPANAARVRVRVKVAFNPNPNGLCTYWQRSTGQCCSG